MKKLLLSSLAMTSLMAFAQIPNNDFEDWNTVTAEFPNGKQLMVGNVSKVADPHGGNFAMKLETVTTPNEDTIPGVMLIGKSDNGKDFTGGVPFTAHPDSIILWMKYNIVTGDTGLVLVVMKKAGVPIVSQWIKFTQFANGYMRKAFKINYLISGQNPDTLIFGALNTNVFQSPRAGSFLQIDDVSFSGTTQNIPNPGFENWTTVSHDFLKQWSNNYYDIDALRNEDIPTVSKSLDKATGSYALKIRNVITATQLDYGAVSTRPDNTPWTGWRGDFPVSGNTDTLYGLYKYAPENDTFTIWITLFNNGIQIGSGYWQSSTAMNSWSVFKIPIANPSGKTPDSAKIEIRTYNIYANGNSVLLVDNLNFNPVYPLGTRDIAKQAMALYPNPASQTLNIVLPTASQQQISVLDMQGRVLQTVEANGFTTAVDISSLKPGMYQVRLNSNNTTRLFQKQ